jgi:hypothetical protein
VELSLQSFVNDGRDEVVVLHSSMTLLVLEPQQHPADHHDQEQVVSAKTVSAIDLLAV